MEQIYFALVDTLGLFASIIRKVTESDYIHVVLAMDSELQEAYSVGRRNPFVPLIAGFEKENIYQIEQAFPTARYRIVSLECTKEQKEQIRKQLEKCYQKRFRYHYCILGLPFILCNKPFYQKNHYTCSSFLAKILEENGIQLFEKHFSLVTPRDFYELPQTEVVYEGALREFTGTEGERRRWLWQRLRKAAGALTGA